MWRLVVSKLAVQMVVAVIVAKLESVVTVVAVMGVVVIKLIAVQSNL